MTKSSLTVWRVLTGIGLLAVAPYAHAQNAVVGTLEPAASGGTHASLEQKVTLSATKPANITREPSYAFKPQYGTIALGNAKNSQITVVLDTDGETTRPKLYVDANGNGDLTDDPAIVLSPAKAAPTGEAKTEAADLSGGDKPAAPGLSATVPVVARYDVAGRGGAVASSLLFTVRGMELTYNREYARVGSLTIGGRVYRLALVDQKVNGKFNDFQHEEGEPARVTLLIDKNNDGRFDPVSEAFDAAKPIRLSGGTYEVTSIDVRGTSIGLRRAGKTTGTLTAADLKVGADALEFQAQTLDGRSVSFPSDYKRKVVLLEFWEARDAASRAELPNLVAAYNQYHAAGFEILGVSLDKPNLLRQLQVFLAQNQVAWPQIYDAKSGRPEAVDIYDVRSVPQAFLVDGTTGKILAMGSDVRGQALSASVAAALSRGQ